MSIESVKMEHVAKKYIVMSGKGGVGKSTVAVNLAVSLALSGKRVGLLDVDIHGPSIPTMVGLRQASLESEGEKLLPAVIGELNDLKVMSIGFMLESEDAPVIWRGPMKNGVIKQFLEDVEWGELDCLIVDCPPGTGDEPLSIIQLLGNADGAIIVTTPQNVAAVDVSKSIKFCEKLGLKIAGIVENMSGFVCPDCGKVSWIFSKDGGKKLAAQYGVPFLGAIPIDPSVGTSGDEGKPYAARFRDSPISATYARISGGLA